MNEDSDLEVRDLHRVPMRRILDELVRLDRAGARRVRLAGAEGSLLALVAAELGRQRGGPGAKPGRRPLVVVARDASAAQALHRDLQFFLPAVAAPAPHVLGT